MKTYYVVDADNRVLYTSTAEHLQHAFDQFNALYAIAGVLNKSLWIISAADYRDGARQFVGGMVADPHETEEYQRFVASMVPHCHCRPGNKPCDGVLAGGVCDDVQDEIPAGNICEDEDCDPSAFPHNSEAL